MIVLYDSPGLYIQQDSNGAFVFHHLHQMLSRFIQHHWKIVVGAQDSFPIHEGDVHCRQWRVC